MPSLEMDPPTPIPPTPNSLKRQHEDSANAGSDSHPAQIHSSPIVLLERDTNIVRFPTPETGKPQPHLDDTKTSDMGPPIKGGNKREADADGDVNMRSRSGSVLSVMSELSELGPESPAKPASLLSSQPIPASSQPSQPLNAFAAMNGIQEPARKRVKLSKEEALDAALKRKVAAAEKAIEKERKEKERAEAAAKKEADRAAKEAEKAEKEAEREAEKKRKEAEKEEKRLAREQEQHKREEAKRAKDEEKRKKEEEKKRAEEEKTKKEGKQQKLNAFFMKPAPKKDASASNSPSKKEKAASVEREVEKSAEEKQLEEYEKTFPPFFVQNNVTLAPITRAERDEGATQRLENDIDDFIAGRKSIKLKTPFSITEAFNMPAMCFPRRGKKPTPVKDIMAQILGATSSKPIDLSTDAYNAQIRKTRDQLKQVSYKFLKFAEDVRPPYVGTYTKTPVHGFKRLARNPLRRELPGVDYDYDSEAEWEPPGEDEEELGSEDEDDEGEGDAEDFDGFLDDAEDELTRNRKMGVGVSELEPISSGLCWEDERGQPSKIEMKSFRMDILNENIRSGTPIDPFSTAYWPSTQPSMPPPRNPQTTLPTTTNPSQPALTTFLKPSTPSHAPSSSSTQGTQAAANNIQNLVRSSSSSNSNSKPKKLLEGEQLQMFKEAVEGSELSKIGLIEVLHRRFIGTGVAKGTLKNTLEVYARREGVKEVEKRWVWK